MQAYTESEKYIIYHNHCSLFRYRFLANNVKEAFQETQTGYGPNNLTWLTQSAERNKKQSIIGEIVPVQSSHSSCLEVP